MSGRGTAHLSFRRHDHRHQVQRAIAAGVKCIEHGFLMDESNAKMLAERGVRLSLQPIASEMADVFPPGSNEAHKF